MVRTCSSNSSGNFWRIQAAKEIQYDTVRAWLYTPKPSYCGFFGADPEKTTNLVLYLPSMSFSGATTCANSLSSFSGWDLQGNVDKRYRADRWKSSLLTWFAIPLWMWATRSTEPRGIFWVIMKCSLVQSADCSRNNSFDNHGQFTVTWHCSSVMGYSCYIHRDGTHRSRSESAIKHCDGGDEDQRNRS